MFSIICDAREGQSLGIYHLALVDRSSGVREWWTSDKPHGIMRFMKRSAAEYSLSRFKFNNPRIVSYAEAVTLIEGQRDSIRAEEQERMFNDAMADCDPQGHGQDTYF